MQSKTPRLATLHQLAYHEAGHAATAVLAGGTCGEVMLQRDPTGRLRGLCRSTDNGLATAAKIGIVLAGPVAESLHTGVFRPPLGADREMLISLAEERSGGILGDAEAYRRAMDLWSDVQAQLVRHWRAVDALAHALLETGRLNQARIEAIVARLE